MFKLFLRHDSIQNDYRGGNTVLVVALLMWSMIISGCALTPVAEKPYDQWDGRIQPNHQMTWWYAKFQMNWTEKADPGWHLDLLLAHEIIAPVLAANRADIALWRFHRRAADDDIGHQFSFIFYAEAPGADKIMEQIASSTLLVDLNRSGALRRVILENTENAGPSDIEETSDHTWSLPLQKAWPHYIMGVSRMWLALIDQYAVLLQEKEPPMALTDLDDLYQRVNREITRTWQTEGRHALLHHMNALFGYTPLTMKLRF